MKTTLALFLALATASCASTTHRSHTKTVADAKRDGGTGGAIKEAAGDGPSITPEQFMSLLRGEDDEPVPTDGCDSTKPHCVTYLRLDGEIGPHSLKKTVAAVKAAKAGQVIMLDINTPGGMMSEGFALEKELEATQATVYCVVDGDAYSMGYLILQSCQKRVMTKRSDLMTHEPALFSQSGTVETMTGLQAQLDDLHVTAEAQAEHGSRRLKISFDEYVRRTSGKPWFMGWKTAKDVGAVDCVFTGANAAEAREQLEAKGELTCMP
jgi:ATP-dependent protease ClpP protease subunit